MAEWSQLPEDLIQSIGKRLTTQLDTTRFRSICSFWRSSSPPKPPLFTNPLPLIPDDRYSLFPSTGFYLSTRTIFLLSPASPSPHPFGWIIKVDHNQTRTRLFNPLSKTHIKFNHTLDLLRFRVRELGQEFVLEYLNYDPPRPGSENPFDSNLYMEKVVVSPLIGGGFLLLTIHVSGKLVLFRSREKKWCIIDDFPPYDDVGFFDGEFYGVDGTGRTVIVDPIGSVKVVAGPVFGGDKKYLVESNGDLLLVDRYLDVGPDENNGNEDIVDGSDEDEEDEPCYEGTVYFKVYRMDRMEGSWNEVKNLGDRMLFCGANSTFSASASDFHGCKGNCIFFKDISWEEDDSNIGHCVCVFDLENRGIASIGSYSKLFWPPPSWVTSTMSGALNQLEAMSL